MRRVLIIVSILCLLLSTAVAHGEGYTISNITIYPPEAFECVRYGSDALVFQSRNAPTTLSIGLFNANHYDTTGVFMHIEEVLPDNIEVLEKSITQIGELPFVLIWCDFGWVTALVDSKSDSMWLFMYSSMNPVDDEDSSRFYSFLANIGAPDIVPYFETAGESQARSYQNGDRNDDIRSIQSRLFELDYPIKLIDGYYDDQTEFCVKLFQRFAGIDATGIADENTINLLFSDSAPRCSVN